MSFINNLALRVITGHADVTSGLVTPCVTDYHKTHPEESRGDPDTGCENSCTSVGRYGRAGGGTVDLNK